MRTIALEEHFVTPGLAGYGKGTASIAQPGVWQEASRRLLDLTRERLPEMDAAGPDMAVLSLNSPGIQAETDPATAVAAAATVIDFLVGFVAGHPDRFAGFAALPLQDPKAAARELDRAVTELGLRGALVSAHTSGVYLDDPPLLCALLALGADRIWFGTDYPFETMSTATAFRRDAPISEPDRAKISYQNAASLLRL